MIANMTLGQKIAFVSAMLFFLAGLTALGGVFLYQPSSSLDPIHASLMASVVFFGGAGFVLYTIATVRLKGLLTLGGRGDSAGH
jgi:hypothetical protein